MKSVFLNGVAVVPAGQIHYIDHLAVISKIFDIPLIVIDEECEALAKKYYPDLKIQKHEEGEISPEYFIRNFDVLFVSDLWKQESFERQFLHLEKTYQKRMRRVFCPHGFSDKRFYFKSCENEDICFIYGQNMLDMLKDFNVLETLNGWVITGNYRLIYYKENKVFFEKIVQDEILNSFAVKKPIILYAPTWQDYEYSTTYFDNFKSILGNLPSDYNLVVKLHPMLEMNDPVAYYSILGQYEKSGNILFLREFPLIYPLLAHTDIYIGDMSSVGYDFLAFDKPMFFLNKKSEKDPSQQTPFLYRCGKILFSEEFSSLYRIIEQEGEQKALSPIRQETYLYTFGEERSFNEIKKGLSEIMSSQNPS